MNDRNRDWERAKEDIRSRVDIVEIVSRYTQLKKAGRDRWKGLCPFHNEKTPSFSVDQVRGFYHCFGCKVSGDIFTIIQQKERMTFPEAMRMLAERAGVELPESSGSAEVSRARTEARQEQHNLLERVAVYYRNLLEKDPSAADAQAYAVRRGLTGEIAETFRIGYSPKNRRTVVHQLESKKIDPAIGVATAVVIASDGSDDPNRKYSYGELRDRFNDRLMFPIEDDRGRVVGFGGRALGDAQPKYLNSPGTELFQKGLILYNFHRARQHIDDDSGAIVVEGYMDAIAFWRAGVKNVVAPLGTALTAEQAQKLVRLTKKIFLCFDADEAGERAAVRSLEVFLGLGVAPFRIVIPSGKDPDDLLASEGPEAVKALVSAAVPMLDRVIERTAASSPKDLVGRQKAVATLLPLFSLVKDAGLRAEMLRQAALAFGFPEKAIEELIAQASAKTRIYRRENDAPPESAVVPHKAVLIPPALRSLIWIFATQPRLRGLIAELAPESYLSGEPLALYGSLVALWKETNGCEPKKWFDRLHEPGLVEAATGILAGEEPRLKDLDSEALERLMRDAVAVFERERLKNRLAELRAELAALEKSSGERSRIEKLSLELVAVTARIKQTIPSQGGTGTVPGSAGEPAVQAEEVPRSTAAAGGGEPEPPEAGYDPADDYYDQDNDGEQPA